MALQNPKELFIHNLSSLYTLEQAQLKALPQLAQDCDDPKVRNIIQEHEQETRQQVQNLEQCFRILNSQPQQMENHLVTAMKKEHEAFMQMNPSKEITKMWAVDKSIISEHVEVAAYTTLVGAATHLGEIRCIDLLEQNRVQEEAMAAKLTQLAYKMGESMTQVRV